MPFSLPSLSLITWVFGVLTVFQQTAGAAPLDALLMADQFHQAGELRFEAGLDAVNSTLDVLKVRGQDPIYAGTSVGDYVGQHLRVGYAVSDAWTIDGSLWRRQLTYRGDDESIDSWQIAAQYRVLGNANSRLHAAVRVSAWGDQSPLLVKNSPTAALGRTVDSLSISDLGDRQTQVDVIGTWRMNQEASVSAFAGVGRSSVSTGNLTAAYTSSGGCHYTLMFTLTETSGELNAPCADPNAILSFGTNQSRLSDFSYQSRMIQLGGMLQWQRGNWALRTGYQYVHINRDQVDDRVTSQGGTPYQDNHTVVVDIYRKLASNMAVFMRGQAMSNQFVGEIPFVYNHATASKFGHRYGLVTLGVYVSF